MSTPVPIAAELVPTTTIDFGQWNNGNWLPTAPVLSPQTFSYIHTTMGYFHVIDEPKYCVGKAHVFACDHEPKCLCGKIQRVMPKVKK